MCRMMGSRTGLVQELDQQSLETLQRQVSEASEDPRIKDSKNANAFATPTDLRKSGPLNSNGLEAAEQAEQAQSDKPPQVRWSGERIKLLLVLGCIRMHHGTLCNGCACRIPEVALDDRCRL